jgi:hypothetical protein
MVASIHGATIVETDIDELKARLGSMFLKQSETLSQDQASASQRLVAARFAESKVNGRFVLSLAD